MMQAVWKFTPNNWMMNKIWPGHWLGQNIRISKKGNFPEMEWYCHQAHFFCLQLDHFFLLSRRWVISHLLVTNAEICKGATGNLRLCHVMLNVWGKNAHGHHPRDAHSYNYRNDVSPNPGCMAARVEDVVPLLKEHRLTPSPSGIESR
jgi:hypothetical protein